VANVLDPASNARLKLAVAQPAALELIEELSEATPVAHHVSALDSLYLRLAHRWQWLSTGAYEHVSEMLAELGKLLGGWIRTTS